MESYIRFCDPKCKKARLANSDQTRRVNVYRQAVSKNTDNNDYVTMISTFQFSHHFHFPYELFYWTSSR